MRFYGKCDKKILIFIESNDTKRNNISNKFQLFYTFRYTCQILYEKKYTLFL